MVNSSGARGDLGRTTNTISRISCAGARGRRALHTTGPDRPPISSAALNPASDIPARLKPHEHLVQRNCGQNVERLAALSDGIFAVAMTLLALDLRVPATEL